MNKPAMREGFVLDKEPVAPVEATQSVAPALPDLVEEWPIKIKLQHSKISDPSRPGLIQELTFRQPTAGDINRCGNPCRIDNNGDLQVDERKMTLIMANLSGVLSPILEQMDARDWSTCRWRLQRFFLPDWAQVFPGSPKTD